MMLLVANLVIWASWLVTQLVGIPLDWLEAVVTSIAIYALGYLGLRRASVFTELSVESPAALAKYAKSALTSEQLRKYGQRLEQLMQLDKPFLEGDLTLADLAQRLSVSPHHLSQLLSVGIKQSFYDFINQHRVAEVQRCLGDSAYAGQTILDIALASGFSSKAAFNAAFKKCTGTTPSALRRAASGSNPTG
jgi:AraC-like DNA-binding protein